ncbi:hypothetical protein CCMA1212_002027 [Trichoderma ghanense]|uniref:Mg2+ transporter protein, CorA-like/Zinc transport protein ZntB n=1 Tax=Trichoderma ghanense TaxID=65468 RepID=A0ABY2HDC0_9HYPO
MFTTDTATISTAVRYDPTTNVARGVFNFTNMHHGFPIYETMADQFVHCSHPLLLPLLAIETTFSIVALHLATYATNLYDVEVQTGHGLGRMDGEVQERQDYRTLVRGLGVAQSQYYLAQGTISWCRISAEFIRDKLQHFQSVLPEERRSRLQLAHRMLNERVEFVLSNLECASVFHGLKERMEAQQTVLFNLIAQSDNLINVGLAKDSKEMAVASKQDSSAMKIIALLTTFFLPGTFIASFFAMPLFDWSEPTLSRVANRHFWVYWAVTGPLTVTIMAGVMAWAVWHNRYVERLQSRARDSVGTNSTDDKGRNKEHHESENGQGKGQYTEQRQGTETEKQGFRQNYSLRKVLNRRKRQFATVEAEP